MIAYISSPHFNNISRILVNESLSNPLITLHELYQNQMAMPVWRQDVFRWLMGVYSKTPLWVGNCPADMIYFVRQMEKLVGVSWWLQQVEPRPEPVKFITKQNVFPPGLNDHPHPRYQYWDFYPRWLSKEELHQPYLALDHFFSFSSLKQWKIYLNEWLKQSLSNTNSDEHDDLYQPIVCFEHLNKLIESTYLIYFREYNSSKY